VQKILDISTVMPACPVKYEAYSSGAVFVRLRWITFLNNLNIIDIFEKVQRISAI